MTSGWIAINPYHCNLARNGVYYVISEEGSMRTLLHFKTHDGGYFHSHPLHSVFSLIASFILSVLIVLLLVSTAR
jgi:hypothetical protein